MRNLYNCDERITIARKIWYFYHNQKYFSIIHPWNNHFNLCFIEIWLDCPSCKAKKMCVSAANWDKETIFLEHCFFVSIGMTKGLIWLKWSLINIASTWLRCFWKQPCCFSQKLNHGKAILHQGFQSLWSSKNEDLYKNLFKKNQNHLNE